MGMACGLIWLLTIKWEYAFLHSPKARFSSLGTVGNVCAVLWLFLLTVATMAGLMITILYLCALSGLALLNFSIKYFN
jgi:hypothetical protein